MCDVQSNLVAWLDGELSADEADRVGSHVESCEACRVEVAAYERVSRTFNLYCDALTTTETRRSILRWVPVFGAAAAVVTLIFVLSSFKQARVALPSPPVPVVATVSTAVAAPELARPKPTHKRRIVPQVRKQVVKWQPTGPVVRIAIPADAMFPPGAMPQGMNFVADLSIASDGSVKQISLRQ